MTRKPKKLLYLLLAGLLLVVTVQRFQAFAARRQSAAAYAAGELPDSQSSRRSGARGYRLRKEDGKTLLWAKGDPESQESQWFDVTDIPLDPLKFQYGIGKDTIPAIDEPLFAAVDDPRLKEQNITDDSRVIGFAVGGDARAYPIRIMNRHELVNDAVGGKPVTVAW